MTSKRLPDPDMSDVGIFECLPVPLQQKVARGEVDLDTLLEMLTRPESDELCPRCGSYPVDRKSPFGFCRPCTLQRYTERSKQALAELKARREYNVAKKKVERARDVLEPDRVRHNNGRGPGSKTRADYGGRSIVPTIEPVALVYCAACGEPFRQRVDETCCPDCDERTEARAETKPG